MRTLTCTMLRRSPRDSIGPLVRALAPWKPTVQGPFFIVSMTAGDKELLNWRRKVDVAIRRARPKVKRRWSIETIPT